MKNKTAARIVAVVATIGVILTLIFGVKWNSLTKTVASSDDDVAATTKGGDWVHYYNLDLQDDGDDSNDFNFGPDPYEEGVALTAEDYDIIFRERLKWDPALAAADTAWLDAVVGTRYLGEFYESCQGDWAKTMNEAKLRFASDQTAFYQNLDAFFAFLDSADKVEVRQCSGVTDQMYMNPYTTDGVPDIIVLETDDQSGYQLVYTFVIKGDTFEVAYRINCGFQPTNVAEIMNITPQEKPTTPTTPTPTESDEPTPTTPTPTPTEPDEPTPTEPETPTYNKNPEKAPSINTEKNDNSGAGEDTNSGSGSTTSAKDSSTNSTSYSSYDEYREEIEEIEEIDESQQTGGSSGNNPSNTPSTMLESSSVTVDNNGSSGNGGASIDTATPVTDSSATDTDTGESVGEEADGTDMGDFVPE